MVRPAATRVASFAAAAAASLSLMTLPPAADAHPLCYHGPDRAVSFTAEATFCPDDDPEGFCCEPDEEDAVAAEFARKTLSAECAPVYKEVSFETDSRSVVVFLCVVVQGVLTTANSTLLLFANCCFNIDMLVVVRTRLPARWCS